MIDIGVFPYFIKNLLIENFLNKNILHIWGTNGNQANDCERLLT